MTSRWVSCKVLVGVISTSTSHLGPSTVSAFSQRCSPKPSPWPYDRRVAAHLGLLDYDVWLETFDGLTMLVVERYDRLDGRRLHQEDMNQALGASGVQKYQKYGGGVTLARVAHAVTRHGADQGLHLLRLVALSAAIQQTISDNVDHLLS